MFYRLFELFKFRIIRFIESNPELNLMIYNNIYLFKFLLPHEKDYYGMLKVCKNKKLLHSRYRCKLEYRPWDSEN